MSVRQSEASRSPSSGPSRPGPARKRPWLLLLSKPSPEQKEAIGRLPIISLFAELLFEVAQGQALSLQHPPVRDFLPAEKVGDDQLTGLESVHPCQLLWLFVTENKMEKQQVPHLKAASTCAHTCTYTPRGAANTVSRDKVGLEQYTTRVRVPYHRGSRLRWTHGRSSLRSSVWGTQEGTISFHPMGGQSNVH